MGIYNTPIVRYGIKGVFASFLLIACGLNLGYKQPDILGEYHPFPSAGPDNINVTALVKPRASAIQGSLKILTYSPSGVPVISNSERELLSQFAQSENLTEEWLVVKDVPELISKLTSGEADMVATLDNRLLNTIEGQVLNTLPWATSKQQVFGRRDSNIEYSLQDLTVRQLAIKRSSPAWQDILSLAADHQTMEILQIPEKTPVDTILGRINTGHYDLAVLDSLSLPEDLEFHYNLEAILDLTEELFMTWGVNTNSVALQKSLNSFLLKKHLETEIDKSYREDFPKIKQRRLLRLITYQSPVNYFYERGKLKGFEYDLIKRFADSNNIRLDVVIANSHDSMLELLNEGKGDVIAASLPENSYAGNKNIKLTDPYNYATPVLVGRDDDKIVDFRDLQGRTIHLPPESPYYQALDRIRHQGIDFTILIAEPEYNTESVLFRVAQGVYDLSVIASHEVNAELSRQLNLKVKFNIGDPLPLAWIVTNTNSLLLSALNEFIDNEYRKGFYNVIYSRYIERPDARITNSSLFAHLDELSPYDEIVHKYADNYGFDWRLIVAQMYQESRFNPRAISEAGAEGLMQIMPTTARMVGIDDLNNPEDSIGGGVRYMHYLKNRFEDSLSVEDRTWFTLASYNAGYNRVRWARKQAVSMGLDKNTWFNNVELAMLNLSYPYNEDNITMRVCRCGETAVYVREIRTLYNNYLRLTQSVKAASKSQLNRDEI